MVGWWLQAPARHLTRFVPAAPRLPCPPATTYTNASTDFSFGAVLCWPDQLLALFFCTQVPRGDRIDRLEVEAAAATAAAVFGPTVRA